MAENLPAADIKKAIESALVSFAKASPAEAKALEAIYRKDVITLGTDEAFALRDSEGEIRAFKTNLRLSIANGGLVKLPFGGPNDNIIVSAQGYEMWQEKAAASVIYPDKALVYGQFKDNPAPIYDANGNWKGWVVSAAAFRLTSLGIPQVCERTVIFDVDNRKNIEFLAKAKKYKQAFRLVPAGVQLQEEKGTWIAYPFDQFTSLYVNAAHDEALDWYGEVSQMLKNSLQLAQTHAARNALKHLSGLQKSPTGPVWDIPVIAWRPTSGSIIKWDSTTYLNLKTKVRNLIAGDRSEFAQIELTKGTDSIDDEDRQAVSEISEEDKFSAVDVATNGNGAAKTEEATPLTDEEKKVMANLAVAKKEFRVEFIAACTELEIEPDADITPAQAESVMKKINAIIDKG